MNSLFTTYLQVLPPDAPEDCEAEKRRMESHYQRDLEKDSLFNKLFKTNHVALIDEEDGVARCSNCNWEVEGNVCHNCGARIEYPRDRELRHGRGGGDDVDTDSFGEDDNSYESDSAYLPGAVLHDSPHLRQVMRALRDVHAYDDDNDDMLSADMLSGDDEYHDSDDDFLDDRDIAELDVIDNNSLLSSDEESSDASAVNRRPIVRIESDDDDDDNDDGTDASEQSWHGIPDRSPVSATPYTVHQLDSDSDDDRLEIDSNRRRRFQIVDLDDSE